jgi:poly-gamma-glutamate capsule biosynthesis protein CapA/YwtB (metallophosphatase superfamily)
MASGPLTVFLAGDVMTGRGVDQILRFPGSPMLQERYLQDARAYVGLAESVAGPIPRPVPDSWPWGDALAVLDEVAPDVRLVNLETSITTSDDFEVGKPVHYRMHPANVSCLTATRPDVCALANNHVMDFGLRGLAETLESLALAGLSWAGAGRDIEEAYRPAKVGVTGDRRVVVSSVAVETSGVPRSWTATEDRAGVALLPDLSNATASRLAGRLRAAAQPGDVLVVSVHWGSNWGYDVARSQVRFAHRLVESGVDIVHGHSSHHPRPIEVYRGRLVLYGCGDLIDDYEGIQGHQRFRDDLRLLYFAVIDAQSHELRHLRMVPMQVQQMRLRRAGRSDVEWLCGVIDGVSRPFGSHIYRDGDELVRADAHPPRA